jgi:hypothetical protein
MNNIHFFVIANGAKQSCVIAGLIRNLQLKQSSVIFFLMNNNE